MMLKVATYNVLHGYYAELIKENLDFLIQSGTNVLCIQEADLSFKNYLNDFLKSQSWEIIYFHTGKACNLAIAWNPVMLTLQNAENIFLPTTTNPSIVQHILGPSEQLRRGAISACFSSSSGKIRITNAHLSWEGGVKHRALQLKYVCERLDNDKVDHDILAGDLNTFAPSFLRHIEGKKVQAALVGWINALPDISWTCDISYNVPADGYDAFAKICRLLRIKFRSRLDYIFVKNLKIISAEMLDLPGSDHRPLVAVLGD